MKPKKRVGRGNASGKGTYSGRGIKGQRARSGGSSGLKKRSYMQQFIKKTPKLGGFISLKRKPVTVTLEKLSQCFSDGDKVNKESLAQKKLIETGESAKIVATGTLDKKLTIEHVLLSKKAAEKITTAGGAVIA